MSDTYKLQWQNTKYEDTITISKSYFEHLLNCLANQKFIDEISPNMKKENQGVIDKAWGQGMFIMSLDVQRQNAYKLMVEKYVEVWNKSMPLIKDYALEDSEKYPNDENINFKWYRLVPQEIEMWMRLCCFSAAIIDCEKEKYEYGFVSDFDYIANRRGFTPTMRKFLMDMFEDIGVEVKEPKTELEDVGELKAEASKKDK